MIAEGAFLRRAVTDALSRRDDALRGRDTARAAADRLGHDARARADRADSALLEYQRDADTAGDARAAAVAAAEAAAAEAARARGAADRARAERDAAAADARDAVAAAQAEAEMARRAAATASTDAADATAGHRVAAAAAVAVADERAAAAAAARAAAAEAVGYAADLTEAKLVVEEALAAARATADAAVDARATLARQPRDDRGRARGRARLPPRGSTARASDPGRRERGARGDVRPLQRGREARRR